MLLLFASLFLLASASDQLGKFSQRDEWWCKDGVCDNKGHCRRDCMTQVEFYHGHRLSRANLFCRHVTHSDKFGEDCYFCCGNSHSCRRGDEKWSAYVATTPGTGERQCVCCYHGEGAEDFAVKPLAEKIDLGAFDDLTKTVIDPQLTAKESNIPSDIPSPSADDQVIHMEHHFSSAPYS